MTKHPYHNPIIRGTHPDPSLCRVGEDYYLCASTFAYFPAAPVFHSRDLIQWQPIGHALTRPEQLPLDGVAIPRGMYAPSLRNEFAALSLDAGVPVGEVDISRLQAMLRERGCIVDDGDLA